jgi:hypothetical protein
VYTPLPADLPGRGGAHADVRRWHDVGVQLGAAIGDLVSSWQIGNELNIWDFRQPLETVEDAAQWVGAFGAGIRDAQPGASLGVNPFGTDTGARTLLDVLYGDDRQIDLDWVGVDGYPGSWQPGGPASWIETIDRVSELGRGKPIVVCEIGYPSGGDVARPGELRAFLASIGYGPEVDEAVIERDRSALLAAASPRLAERLAALPAASWEEDFTDTASHLIRKWPRSWGPGGMTPEKQQRYFEEALPVLLSDGRVLRVLLFIFRLPETCWTCGREDCPLETQWGFVDAAGRRKPVFDAIRRMLRGGLSEVPRGNADHGTLRPSG